MTGARAVGTREKQMMKTSATVFSESCVEQHRLCSGGGAAQELVAAGDSVVICGRDERRLTAAAEALRRRVVGSAAVHALRCDVSNGHGAHEAPPDVCRMGRTAFAPAQYSS